MHVLLLVLFVGAVASGDILWLAAGRVDLGPSLQGRLLVHPVGLLSNSNQLLLSMLAVWVVALSVSFVLP